MFRSAVKPDAVHAPLALLKEARTALDVPVVAIGGITADNAGDVFAHGAHAVAVITDLFHASDVRARAALFTTLAAAHSRPGAFTTTEIHRS
jgi:thiamine-phosphate pyrophosphorylase